MGELQASGGWGVLLPSVWALKQDLGLLAKRGGMALRDLHAWGTQPPAVLSRISPAATRMSLVVC